MRMRRPDRTLGPGHDEFWAYCAQGELRLPRCEACGHWQWPVAAACEHCGGTTFRFAPVSGRGRIASWCGFVQDYYKGVLPVPYDTILVALDEGPLFIANPAGFGGDEIRLDQPVAVTFEPATDAGGDYMLPVFVRAA